METSVMAAVISVVGSIIVAMISFYANRKGAKEASETNAKLIAYRIQELEKKQDKHNSMIERTFNLEGKMTEVEHDIRDIKRRMDLS